MLKPDSKPNNPYFSSGPTSKRPGWKLSCLQDAVLGRSHRSKPAKDKINELTLLIRTILQIPEDFWVAITPASDTGAFEMAMWSLLGPKPVDVLVWDLFGLLWQLDITKQLRLESRILTAEKGMLPDFSQVNPDHDLVFCWNGTTSGLIVPDVNWISNQRDGLVFCDITSAVFAVDIDWTKLDAASFSWQKCMGGEAQHGVLILSPKAQERLKHHTPSWPMPRLFRLTQNGQINTKIFEGDTINTPSLLVIEDALDALYWIEEIGGLEATKKRCQRNLEIVKNWVEKTEWIAFNALIASTISPTSICLTIETNEFKKETKEKQWEYIASIAKALEEEKVAFDIKGHALGDPCLRLWGGPTIEASDIEKLLPWIEWGFLFENRLA